jgi:predicted dehydrogenase
MSGSDPAPRDSASDPAPDPALDARPQLPADPALRGGVAILGAGDIARTAHLSAYRHWGVGVVGTWSPGAVRGDRPPVRDEFPFVEREFATPEELLADDAVRVVDVATPAAVRLPWVRAAVEAGKHVLAQKPLTSDAAGVVEVEEILAEADRRGVRVAVNHNGRWAPPWRVTSLLLRQGAVGDVVGVTHLHDKPLPPLVGTPFDDLEHMLVTDYLVHWLDITRLWLRPGRVVRVQTTESRVPGQPVASRNPWSATVLLTADTGATACIRVVGDAQATSGGAPFWVHGTQGTIRGSVLLRSDRVELDRDGDVRTLPTPGAWFTDAFAASMGELLTAIAQDREPENSATDALETVRLVLAARDSAAGGGAPGGHPAQGTGTP